MVDEFIHECPHCGEDFEETIYAEDMTGINYCPFCSGEIIISDDYFQCVNCHLIYPQKDGYPLKLSFSGIKEVDVCSEYCQQELREKDELIR